MLFTESIQLTQAIGSLALNKTGALREFHSRMAKPTVYNEATKASPMFVQSVHLVESRGDCLRPAVGKHSPAGGLKRNHGE